MFVEIDTSNDLSSDRDAGLLLVGIAEAQATVTHL
jgi:hypothetical protein